MAQPSAKLRRAEQSRAEQSTAWHGIAFAFPRPPRSATRATIGSDGAGPWIAHIANPCPQWAPQSHAVDRHWVWVHTALSVHVCSPEQCAGPSAPSQKAARPLLSPDVLRPARASAAPKAPFALALLPTPMLAVPAPASWFQRWFQQRLLWLQACRRRRRGCCCCCCGAAVSRRHGHGRRMARRVSRHTDARRWMHCQLLHTCAMFTQYQILAADDDGDALGHRPQSPRTHLADLARLARNTDHCRERA